MTTHFWSSSYLIVCRNSISSYGLHSKAPTPSFDLPWIVGMVVRKLTKCSMFTLKIYQYVYMYTYACVCACVRVYTHANAHTHICGWINLCTHSSMCMNDSWIPVCVCEWMFVWVYSYICDVSIMTQTIKRVGEGIAAIDSAGRSEEGVCDMHHQIWIRKNARQKKLSEVGLPLSCGLPLVFPTLVCSIIHNGHRHYVMRLL